MASKQLPELHLDHFATGMPGLTPSSGRVLAEAAVVCLEEPRHRPGVQLAVKASSVQRHCLQWTNSTDQQRRTYDLWEATEKGACAVAILVIHNRTGKVVVDRAKRGTGFDYWVGLSKDDDPPFQVERLEVSGILRGTDGDVKRRIQEKCRQTQKSDHMAIRAYVVIVEFSRPEVSVVER